jgi:DNA-binding CsgD family transcriptional regulator
MSVIDDVGCGTILIDGQGLVIEINAAATRQLGDGLQIADQRLTASDARTDELLQDLIRRGVSHAETAAASSTRRVLAVPRPGKRPVTLRVIPVESHDGPLHRNARAVVVLVDPEGSVRPSEIALKVLFRLTPAEVRIADRLVSGETLPDIAAALDVTIATLRTQLKSMFAKTQTHRQAELVALLARLAPGTGR